MKRFRQKHRPKKSSLVIGRENVKKALEAQQPLDKIYIQNTGHGKILDEIRALAATQRVPISKVPIEKLNGFNIAGHEGVVAQLSHVQYFELQQVISFVVDRGETPLFLLLDGITDIRNLGGIARTAYCCGVHALVIPGKGTGALNDDAVLTSAGALEKLPVCRVHSLLEAINELQLNGIRVMASDLTATKNVFNCDFNLPVAIVMGSEDKGVQPAVLKRCDEKFKIPMRGDFDSLNVSVATGMILYEVMIQRMTATQ